MDLRDLVSESEPETWDGYPSDAWKKPSLAVVVQASNETGGCILFAAGPAVRCMLEENGLSRTDEIGLDDAPEGISVWEGKLVGGGRCWSTGEYEDPELKGTFRAPTDEEWAAIRENRCPWDDAGWRS